MEIYTIGFTQSTAEHFFRRLGEARVGRLLDVRLNNSSQLAGFAKAKDLPYLLGELIGASYEHEPLLAPTQQLLDEYKKRKGDWGAPEDVLERTHRDMWDALGHIGGGLTVFSPWQKRNVSLDVFEPEIETYFERTRGSKTTADGSGDTVTTS